MVRVPLNNVGSIQRHVSDRSGGAAHDTHDSSDRHSRHRGGVFVGTIHNGSNWFLIHTLFDVIHECLCQDFVGGGVRIVVRAAGGPMTNENFLAFQTTFIIE